MTSNILYAVNKDNSSEGQVADNAKFKFKIIDEQSGIYNKVDTVEAVQELSSRDNLEPDYFEDLGRHLQSVSIKNQITSHPNYIYNRLEILYKENISGTYYAWTGNYTIIKDGKTTLLTDNVGNEIVQSAKFGPYNVDYEKPILDKVYIGDEGKGKIVITDDFSGLSKDPELLKKIKYAWVKDKNTTPDSSSLNSIDPKKVDYTNENKFNEFNTLTATVDLPTESSQYYLYAYVDGYEDISGNPMENSSTVSEDYSGYDTNLQVEVKENNSETPVNPSNIEITVRSPSNGNFKISKIWWDYDGLDDDKTYNVPIYFKDKDKVYNASFKTNFNVSVNGPIIVHVVDSYGNDYHKEFEVREVQDTILECNIPANTKFALPCVVGENIIYHIDWGDGTANYCNERCLAYVFSNDSEVTNLATKNTPFHIYKNGSTVKQIKISGNITGLNFAFYDDLAENMLSDYAYLGKLIKDSGNCLIKIKQFGIHNVTQMDGWYSGCSNLNTIEVSEVNKNAFKKIIYTYDLFENTNISEFPKGLFDYATNLKVVYSMFRGCKSLSKIDVDIFANNPKLHGVYALFYGTEKLESLPTNSSGESIFHNNLKLDNFDDTFRIFWT